MNIKDKLLKIQNKISVPKSHYNNFGKYNYRNAEDILNAVKPLCEKYQCLIVVSDDIVFNSEECYVKATATLLDIEKDDKIVVTAYAREALDKKGMGSEQMTGSASSYARKYALNGLLALDDIKDQDSQNNIQPRKPQLKPISEIVSALETAPIDKINSMLDRWNGIKNSYSKADQDKVDTFISEVLK